MAPDGQPLPHWPGGSPLARRARARHRHRAGRPPAPLRSPREQWHGAGSARGTRASVIDARHVSKPGRVVFDITTADEETALALMDGLQQLWAASGITTIRRDPTQPGVRARMHTDIRRTTRSWGGGRLARLPGATHSLYSWSPFQPEVKGVAKDENWPCVLVQEARIA
ncbi:DUF6207 family protein [Streptomyces anulatus]|uniref:DUF6207 family protein n=1 Tax=Streptomyces anulatus TaxID=1892 RepID=UPI003652A7B7